MLSEVLDKKKYPSGCKVFVNSISDIFYTIIGDEHLKMLFDVMGARKDVTFQVLTKRHYRCMNLSLKIMNWRLITFGLI